MADSYEVGYGKPPQHTRFKKGESGHPAGRPRGSTNVTSELKGLLAAKTTIDASFAAGAVLVQRGAWADARALLACFDHPGLRAV